MLQLINYLSLNPCPGDGEGIFCKYAKGLNKFEVLFRKVIQEDRNFKYLKQHRKNETFDNKQ